MGRDTVDASGLDPKMHALLRLGASLAVDAALEAPAGVGE
jgi:hypothetical protein